MASTGPSAMLEQDYPRLPLKEVVLSLSEFKIANVAENNLLHPEPDFVSDLYKRILCHVDLYREDDGQINSKALQQFENPELFSSAIHSMNLFNKIRGFVAALHCPKKFNLGDLVRPDSDRTCYFLSAMLNFVLYREHKMDSVRPILEEMSLIEGQRKELEGKIEELNAEIADHNKARESEVPRVHEVETKVKELRQTIHGLNNHQMSLKASINKMKDNAKKMDEKISSAEFALVQAVRENANLRSKIIQSPDKLQKALVEGKAILAEAKNAERSAMLSFQEKSSTFEVYTKAYEKMSKHFALMQDIQEQVNSAKAIEEEVKVLKLKLTDEGVLDKSLEAKLVERQGKAGQLDELQKQLEKERKLKCEAATKELTDVKLEVELRKHGNESRQRNVEAIFTEVDAIEAKIKSAKDSSAAKQQELGLKCEEIVKEFYQYKNRLEESWALLKHRQ